jgi:Protein of unknown function (DUF2589)
MATVEFDALIQALQSAVGAAQLAISKRHQGSLQRLVDLDGEGKVEGASYFFEVSTGDPVRGGPGTVRLPLLTLRPHIAPQIAAVAVEFDAVIEEVAPVPERRAPAPRPSAPEPAAAGVPGVASVAEEPAVAPAGERPPSLILAVKRRGEPVRRVLHRIRISLTGPQPGIGEITVDGAVLKTLRKPADG